MQPPDDQPDLSQQPSGLDAVLADSAVAGERLLRLWGYTSSHTGADVDRDLRDIAEVSSRNNRRDDVTGALLFDAGRFVQVLEGPEESISRIISRIGQDPRCGDMVELFDVRVTHRSMEAWDLWVGRTEADGGLAVDDLERFRDMYRRGFRLDAGGFVTLLRSLIQTFAEPR